MSDINTDTKIVDYSAQIKNPVKSGRFSTDSYYRNPGDSSSKFNLRLQPDVRAAVEKLAAQEGRTLNEEIQHLLSAALSQRINKDVDADVSVSTKRTLVASSDEFNADGTVKSKSSSKLTIRVVGVPEYVKNLNSFYDHENGTTLSVADSLTILSLPGTKEYEQSLKISSIGAASTILMPNGDIQVLDTSQKLTGLLPKLHQAVDRKVIGNEVFEDAPIRSTDAILHSLEARISELSTQFTNTDNEHRAKDAKILDTLISTHKLMEEKDKKEKEKRSLLNVNFDVKIAEKGINVGNINSNNVKEADTPDTRTGVQKLKDGVFKVYDALASGTSAAVKPIGMACVAAAFAFGSVSLAHKAMPDVFPEATSVIKTAMTYVSNTAPKLENYISLNADRIEGSVGTDGVNVSLKAKTDPDIVGPVNSSGIDKEQSEARTNFMYMVTHYGEGNIDKEAAVEKIKVGVALMEMYNLQNAMAGKPPLVTKEIMTKVVYMITPSQTPNKLKSTPSHGL